MRIPLQAHRAVICAGILCCMLFCLATPARATVWTLLDENSSVDIDTGDQSGVFNWFVDGVDQLHQQWFWFRVGNTAEASIDTLPINVQGVSDGNFDGDDDTLFVSYDGGTFDIELTLILDGGSLGSGGADLAEQISIVNKVNAPLTISFFQYADFDLNGDAAGDIAEFLNANTVGQSDGSVALTEEVQTVVTPVPVHREIKFFPTTLTKLNDGVASNLDDTPGFGVPLGPGDVTWAFQWDVIIPAFGTFQISKDKNITLVPEPSSWLLMACGAFFLAARARRLRRG